MARKSQLGTACAALATTMGLGIPTGTVSANVFETVNQVMTLNDAVTYSRPKPLSVNNTLNLVSVGSRTFPESANNTITLSDVVVEFNYVGDRQPVGNVLGLTDSVLTLASIALEDDLGITDSVVVQAPIKPSIVHWLAISDHTSTPFRAYITDTLAVSHLLNTPVPLTVNNIISFADLASMSGIAQLLGLTDAATAGKGLDITQNITITHSNIVLSDWIRSIADPSGIGHSLTYYEDTPCNRKQYTPFLGENTSSDDFTDPPRQLQAPQGSLTDRFSLYYPPIGSRTNQVVLRAPELDNRDRNAYTRVNRETRGGHLSVYSDPDWPSVRTLAVTIIGLTEAQVDELQTFLQATIGQEIGLTDWEGNIWYGFVTNPSEEATQDGKDRWTVTLEFQGERDTAEHPGGDNDGQTLSITDSAMAVIV